MENRMGSFWWVRNDDHLSLSVTWLLQSSDSSTQIRQNLLSPRILVNFGIVMLDKHLYITSTGVSKTKTSASATFQWCTIEAEYVLCTHTLSLKSCTAVCCSLCLDFDSLYKQTKVLNTGQLHTVTMAAHISTHAPIKLGELQKNSIAVLSAVNIDVHC